MNSLKLPGYVEGVTEMLGGNRLTLRHGDTEGILTPCHPVIALPRLVAFNILRVPPSPRHRVISVLHLLRDDLNFSTKRNVILDGQS